MAPLSVVPGRMRFEASALIADKEGCLLLEELLHVAGVTEVAASHRTGRVLLKFDENIISRMEVEAHLASALQAVALKQRQPSHGSRSKASRDSDTAGVGHFVMEMALHAFLPGPLDLLLPMAASAFRK